MKRADDYLVFCSKTLRTSLEKGGCVYLFERGGVAILCVRGNEIEKLRYPYHVVMDRFVLVDVGSDPNEVATQLFEYVAPFYESIIDRSRNEENIGLLLESVISLADSRETLNVLDYGCGTGLSQEVASRYEISLIGCDNSGAMLGIARNKGMDVGALAELEARGVVVDGIIASYAMHFHVDKEELGRIWQLLKPGGIFAANFHKNRNSDEVSHIMRELGATIVPIEKNTTKYAHGNVVAFVKK